MLQQPPPCPWDWHVCGEAARGGHLEVLQWLLQQQPPYPCDKALAEAAARGCDPEELRQLGWRGRD